jgi:hypothetical protein
MNAVTTGSAFTIAGTAPRTPWDHVSAPTPPGHETTNVTVGQLIVSSAAAARLSGPGADGQRNIYATLVLR